MTEVEAKSEAPSEPTESETKEVSSPEQKSEEEKSVKSEEKNDTESVTLSSESKDKVIFLSADEAKVPSKVTLDEASADDGPPGLIMANGEINWNCPCLGGMAVGPCGVEFREAFSCFHYSTADPKGSDCIEKFADMQVCMAQYPELYDKKDEPDPNETDAKPAAEGEAATNNDDKTESAADSSEQKSDTSLRTPSSEESEKPANLIASEPSPPSPTPSSESSSPSPTPSS
eukprot:TRINITY_DN8222_c0_g1_i15.p1 TRINITY_DN8222_c0_g1~~TRINITY_DN8222_c0_g1_i15.p1  ORF type:complete len:231 (+),score=67.43 TRINITY_DN8222_c0_g1_i15:50-742(+)